MGLFLLGAAVAVVLLFKLCILAYLLFDGAGWREKRKAAVARKHRMPLRDVLGTENAPLAAKQVEFASHVS
ncbi:MAG TPA: hypothetical protein VGD78_19110 [Chthoniobacterales bacterium]